MWFSSQVSRMIASIGYVERPASKSTHAVSPPEYAPLRLSVGYVARRRLATSRRKVHIYVVTTYVVAMLGAELKKGSAEFLVLSLLEHEKRHGYELNKLIESRSRGALTFHIASLYPLLYRMEDRGWIVGRWVEKAGERRRRFYSISAAGRRALHEMRESWLEFATAVALVTGVQHG
jgi:PadR family transcriptional regulator, regulatory protein PadR